VDRTASYLEQARARADDDALDIEWIRADMREFRREAAFDLVVNLLTSFGYFKDPADDQRVAENVLASLKPGGQLVMELMGKEILARVFRPTDWHREPDGTLVLEERKLTEDWSRLKARWIILKEDGERYDRNFELRLFGASDLKRVLQDAGFARVDVYGSLEKAPYDHQAERLVIVARK
jgi:SAM-dependent methyltransferase